MTSPLFSIITISYQNLDGLQATTASVQRQSFGDFEHIIVDGGSSDGSREWLTKEFSQTWVSERDRGRYHAMNKGAALASGEYLWFLHAGDVFGDADVLKRVSAALDRRPQWLYGLARVVHPDGSLQGTLGFVPFSMFNFGVLGIPLPHQAIAMRRELFERLGGYSENMPISADQALLLRAADVEAPLALPDFLCNFDSTGISAGRAWWKDYLDGEQTRRKLSGPITGSRAADTAISLGFAVTRQLARLVRRLLFRPAVAQT